MKCMARNTIIHCCIFTEVLEQAVLILSIRQKHWVKNKGHYFELVRRFSSEYHCTSEITNENSSHFPRIEEAEKYTNVVLDFLEK